MSSFPKIIHQCFGFWDSNIPPNIQKRIDIWKSLHPKYKYILWDKKKSRELIKTHFDWFLGIYDNYPYPIQRADAIRYFILYKYGGIYCDIDLEPVKKISTLLEKYRSKQCILYRSPNSDMLTNDFMISKPKNIFWKKVWHQLILNCNFSSVSKHLTIMNSTGPLLIDYAYDNFSLKKKYVYIIDAKYINNCDIATPKPARNKGAYFKRYDGNSWHSLDSSIINFFYKNYIIFIVLFFIIVFIIIIVQILNNKVSNIET
jgi:mannosyltransferase OCH1-like enzyme